MSNYREQIKARRRLMMLVLCHKLGNVVNVDVMHLSLSGIVPGTLDDLRADMAWLVTQGLASMHTLTVEVQCMELTRRGAEVATGSNTHVGVARLMPGDLDSL